MKRGSFLTKTTGQVRKPQTCCRGYSFKKCHFCQVRKTSFVSLVSLQIRVSVGTERTGKDTKFLSGQASIKSWLTSYTLIHHLWSNLFILFHPFSSFFILFLRKRQKKAEKGRKRQGQVRIPERVKGVSDDVVTDLLQYYILLIRINSHWW